MSFKMITLAWEELEGTKVHTHAQVFSEGINKIVNTAYLWMITTQLS